MQQPYNLRLGGHCGPWPCAVNKLNYEILLMRSRTQFHITVSFAKIHHTPFGRHLCQQQLTGNQRLELICEHFLPLLEKLAPQTSVQGLTVEDFLHSPTYHLELVPAAVDDNDNEEGVVIEAEEQCSDTPSYDMSPMPSKDLPLICQTLARYQASTLRIAQDTTPLRTLQGRVIMTSAEEEEGGERRAMFFKPREAGREGEFDRELHILHQIKEAGLIQSEQIKVPELFGIVVSGDTTVGMLMPFIISPPLGAHLLDPGVWRRPDLHPKWEAQVTATVQKLHDHDIVWGDVNPCNVVVDEALDAWVIDFGGRNNFEFVDDEKVETREGDWQGVERLFRVRCRGGFGLRGRRRMGEDIRRG